MAKIHIGTEPDMADMDFQDRLATDHIGPIDDDRAIEAAGTKKGGIESFRTIGGRHDDDASIGIEAIHFHEKLIQSLFPFIVTADDIACASLTEGIQLVDEDD